MSSQPASTQGIVRLVPLKEWAYENGVHYRTAHRYAKMGKIECVEGVAGRKLFVSKSPIVRLESIEVLPDNFDMGTKPVLLNLRQAAGRLGLSSPGVRRRLDRGTIKADAFDGRGRALFLQSRIEAMAGGTHARV